MTGEQFSMSCTTFKGYLLPTLQQVVGLDFLTRLNHDHEQKTEAAEGNANLRWTHAQNKIKMTGV